MKAVFGTPNIFREQTEDALIEDIGHIQTLLASIVSLLDDIPDEVKKEYKVGFVSSFSVKGEAIDVNIIGKGEAIKHSFEALIDCAQEAMNK